MHKEKVKRKCSKTQFLELLLSLIKSGMQFPYALKALCKNPYTGSFAELMKSEIENGSSVSESICSLCRKYKGLEVILSTAEESGNIVQALEDCVIELKEKEEEHRNLAAVLAYPVMVCLLALGFCFVLIVFGLPYISLIADVSEEDFMNTVFAANIWLLVSVILIFSVIRYVLHKEDFCRAVFCNLYYLNKNSVSMEDAFLILLKKSFKNKKDLKSISFILRGLRDGKKLNEVCETSGRFDSFSVLWLFAAEENGNTQAGLKAVMEHYQNKHKQTREQIQRVIEPLFMAVCGVYILILITGCVVPVFLSLGNKIL